MGQLLLVAILCAIVGLALSAMGLWRITGLTLLVSLGFGPFLIAIGVVLYIFVVLVDLHRRHLL